MNLGVGLPASVSRDSYSMYDELPFACLTDFHVALCEIKVGFSEGKFDLFFPSK